MKWKTAFTANEASMIAAGIEWFYKLSSDSQAKVLGEDFDSIHEWLEAEPATNEQRVEIDKIKQQIENKEAIHQALLDEISFADSCSEMDETTSSLLHISVREQRGSVDNRIDVEKSKVTGASLALWFWKFDREIAAKFDENIDRKMEPLLSGNSSEVLPGQKTVNSYLRLIYAL